MDECGGREIGEITETKVIRCRRHGDATHRHRTIAAFTRSAGALCGVESTQDSGVGASPDAFICTNCAPPLLLPISARL